MGTLSSLLESLADEPGLRGRQFEHICQWFLTNDPLYRRDLRRVWLWDEWPGRWGADAGIDLVAEDQGGHLWAIQAKAYDPAYSITKADMDTFLSESGRSEFAFRLLIATTNRLGRTAERTLRAQEKPAGCLLLSGSASCSSVLARVAIGSAAGEASAKATATPSASSDHGRGAVLRDGEPGPDDHGVRDREDFDSTVRRSATRCQADTGVGAVAVASL